MNILISPLNWGLGHACRIVPIIKSLIDNHNITIAATGEAFDFLKSNFPNLKIQKTHDFSFKYSQNPNFTAISVFFQFYKLILLYIQNKKWVKQYQKNNKIDLIISDNNFGFFSKKTKSVFITHQINIQAKWKILIKIIFWLNKINIQKFSHCLIPDNNLEFKISGILSEPNKISIPTKYIGILSHLQNIPQNISKPTIDVLCLISGIEPQRSVLEKTIFNVFQNTKIQTTIVGGKTSTLQNAQYHNIHYLSFANSTTMSKFIKSADLIIARAGYSTICDLIGLQKTAILIPTPNQTEQEYLAKHLLNNKLFYFLEQKKINLENILYFSKIKSQYQQNIEKLNLQFFEPQNINFLLK